MENIILPKHQSLPRSPITNPNGSKPSESITTAWLSEALADPRTLMTLLFLAYAFAVLAIFLHHTTLPTKFYSAMPNFLSTIVKRPAHPVGHIAIISKLTVVYGTRKFSFYGIKVSQLIHVFPPEDWTISPLTPAEVTAALNESIQHERALFWKQESTTDHTTIDPAWSFEHICIHICEHFYTRPTPSTYALKHYSPTSPAFIPSPPASSPSSSPPSSPTFSTSSHTSSRTTTSTHSSSLTLRTPCASKLSIITTLHLTIPAGHPSILLHSSPLSSLLLLNDGTPRPGIRIVNTDLRTTSALIQRLFFEVAWIGGTDIPFPVEDGAGEDAQKVFDFAAFEVRDLRTYREVLFQCQRDEWARETDSKGADGELDGFE